MRAKMRARFVPRFSSCKLRQCLENVRQRLMRKEEGAKIRGEVPQAPKSDMFAPTAPSMPSLKTTSIGVSAAPKGSDSNPSTILFNHLSLQKSEPKIVSHARTSCETIEHESDLVCKSEGDVLEIDGHELHVNEPAVYDIIEHDVHK